jgi:hypothetical protein
MGENDLYVYHIVTRNKMNLGQVIYFDNDQKNTLYRFFFEKEQLNAKGEDFIQILNAHYTSDGLKMDKEDAIPFSRKIEQAREYWKGNVNNELPELLINGKIEVVEIIEEFSS